MRKNNSSSACHRGGGLRRMLFFFLFCGCIQHLPFSEAAIDSSQSATQSDAADTSSLPRRLTREEDDPAARQRARDLYDQLKTYAEVVEQYGDRKQAPSLEDHLNEEASRPAQTRRRTTSESTLPPTRSWIIGLTATPIWLCESGDDCPSPLDQQDLLIEQLKELFPEVQIKGQVQHILNAIYVELPREQEITLTALPSHLVEYARIQETYRGVDNLADTVDTVGGRLAQEYCLTGEGITVGVLDTGIDYTHAAFGGPGTLDAFREAYGVGPNSPENTQRDGLFPTDKVIEGIDYLGEDLEEFVQDDDPIDAQGHGTKVASAIVAVAPNVDLIAVKACLNDESIECKEFALIQGIEYLTDPNRDGIIDDKVDVLNLSVARAFTRPFHDSVVRALENAGQLGIVCVTAFGNNFNIPYIAGSIGAAPNVISVGATNQPTEDNPLLYMERYSSRGPGERNLLKPDISAPGSILLAEAGSGTGYVSSAGTSFSAPLVAGAAALLKEQCPQCDPLAIKALLMGSADRTVGYSEDEPERSAPITRMGSGQLRVDRALNATLWAISFEERQASLTFGTVNAFADIIFTKTIEVNAIDDRPRFLRFSAEYRDPSKNESLVMLFNPPEVFMPGGCERTVAVQVQAFVRGGLAPPNSMTTSGVEGYDPAGLDRHEFDGHIIISSDIDQEAALPFHMLLRQAANPVLGRGTALTFERGPIDENFTIVNEGAGTAQIDAYELIYSELDRPEASYGDPIINYDIRTIGYRTIPVGEPDCAYSVEFNVQTWERYTHVGLHAILAEIYPEGDDGDMLTLFLPTYPSPSESYVRYSPEESICTGLSSDHSSNTANTILRACSNDLRLDANTTTDFTVQFRVAAYPFSISEEFVSSRINLKFPEPRLSAPSYDIPPQTTLEEFHVTGEIGPESFGLQLVTNAYRDPSRTGASTFETETILLLKQGIVLEQEVTPDRIIWPGLFNQDGPACGSGLPEDRECAAIDIPASEQEFSVTIRDGEITGAPDCPPVDVPRLDVPTAEPTVTPSQFPTIPLPPPTSRRPTLAPATQATLPPSGSPQRTIAHLTLLLAACLLWRLY